MKRSPWRYLWKSEDIRKKLLITFLLLAIYRLAAERFPAVRQALNRLSDRVIFPNVITDDRVLRSL